MKMKLFMEKVDVFMWAIVKGTGPMGGRWRIFKHLCKRADEKYGKKQSEKEEE